ncbi:YjbH domain-containing protein [Oceanicella actignis]|uniref:Exopolysaccharide biosynthesis protein YbjH n=1 Tax=Oceanicella actignis TaxID=1189325 RepID=A0A1M7T5Z5_9RHOB|nr:YjbH domain-containing protein [Oceanicella actignis]SET43872.1 Exopolysaccharide biosynthesis protein YbjH [Oceanicella actignis]SHN66108.1 Exopolysaccharide biosynthesis protein YbjH [Oceanicella actignis]
MTRGRGAATRATGAVLAGAAVLLSGAPAPARAPGAADRPSLNLYGVTGLIDMPSAQSQPDGQASLTTSWFGGYLRNTFHFQALPRLEGTFRYAIIDEFYDGGAALYDRSFDLKFRISDETALFPAVAIGLQDMLGTGVYSGEYIVATKHLTPDVTLTGGMGWGRFAELNGVENPLRWVASSAGKRERLTGDATGQVRLGQFFRGPNVGFFGGIEWRTPIEGLRLKAEYSPDRYTRERKFGGIEQRAPFNFGLEYRPFAGLELGAYAMYGTEFGLRATFTANPDAPMVPQDLDDGPAPIAPRRAAAAADERFGPVREMIDDLPAGPMPAGVGAVRLERAGPAGARWARARVQGYDCPADAARAIDAELGMVDGVTFVSPGGAAICSVVLRPAGRAWIEAAAREARVTALTADVAWHQDPKARAAALEALRAALAEEGLELAAARLEPTRAQIELRNPRYRHNAQAVGRAAARMAATLPPSVELFDVTLLESSLPTVTVQLRRSLLEDQAGDPDGARRSWLGARVFDADPDARPAPPPGAYPRLSWSLTPTVPVNLFDPDEPLRADLRLVASGAVELARGLSVTARGAKRVVGTLDQITRESNSTLPHVRSDFALYLREGDPALERLSADFLFKPAPAVFGRVSAGLLEPMFAGIGAELLWKRADLPLGLGVELNHVRQRDYDQRFGLLDYEVTTGHASVYWKTGWFGLEAQVDAGRYLAGDWGATFSLTRRFANGWEVGGFFTLTDVPFDEYGEGSFDKGIRVTIPFGWALPGENRSSFRSVLKPLTRDGGQRLEVDNRLWPMVRDSDRAALREQWGTFWK